MKELWETINSPVWLVSVVVVGVLINVASNYLQRRLDTAQNRFSSRRRKRREKESAQRLEEVEKLRGDPHAQIMARFDGIDLLVRTGANIVLCFVVMSNLVVLFFLPTAEGLSELAAQVFRALFTVTILSTFAFAFALMRRENKEMDILWEALNPAPSEEVDDDTE